MEGQEEIIKDGVGDSAPDEQKGNEPDAEPLSKTGYKINPDGSIGHPGEEWDKD